jgi:excisionase family DNA binding protein
MENIYSTKEASDRLKLSQAHIRRLLESGQIPGKKLGHDWVVLSLKYERKRAPKTNIKTA